MEKIGEMDIGSTTMGILDIIAAITIIIGLGFELFPMIIAMLLFTKGVISLI